jgi:hypothetical protein
VALAPTAPDLLAFQEVTRRMVETLQCEFADIGLHHAVNSSTVASSSDAKRIEVSQSEQIPSGRFGYGPFLVEERFEWICDWSIRQGLALM